MAASRRVHCLPTAGGTCRLSLSGVWERAGRNKTTLLSPCNMQHCQGAVGANRGSQEGWGGECAGGSTREQQEQKGGKNVLGQRTRCSLGVQNLGLRLLQSKHTVQGLGKAALRSLLNPAQAVTADGCAGTGWQNLQNKAGLPPHWEW